MLLLSNVANAETTKPESLLERIERLTSEKKTTEALGLAEFGLQASGDPRSDGKLQKAYWNLIRASNDYPRAFWFFSALADKRPEDPTTVATLASAIGGYLGWLHNADVSSDELSAALDKRARGAYAKALEIEPDNFSALFGFAIYESYLPAGATKSKELFARLDKMRPAHPELPWSEVDAWKKRLPAR